MNTVLTNSSGNRISRCKSDHIENNGQERQCASYRNGYAYNSHYHGYYNGRAIPIWSLNPAGQTNAGGAPCVIPSGQTRIHSAYNTGG